MCSHHKISDDVLADKFRRENAEQFHILVRMHLSFVLDLNTEDSILDRTECFNDKTKYKKWNLVPFAKKFKTKNPFDGAPLTQEGICQIYQLIEFLKKEQNIKSEGIFRRTGSIERQQELRSLLSQGITLQLEGGNYSVHDCASVLKGFLAELPDPLLTEAHFPAYCQIAELCGIVEKTMQEGKLLEALQLILLLLPTDNKVLLKEILDLLHLTAHYESDNKMSPDNLAKLFTPHLLCPRKLSPESLLTNSQTLFGIVAFMIKKSPDLFKIPPKLIVDFRARYEKRKILSPNKLLNESVSDRYAANTVFTFVDQERTAKENESNPTETALAQLYAHIQSLPESSKKRKLVKQFNKENGHGTPLQFVRSGIPKNKSLGDSIKKHIFQKGLVRSVKKAGFSQLRASSEEILSSPHHHQQSIVSRARLFCTNCDSSTDVSNDETTAKKLKKSTLSTENLVANAVLPSETTVKRSKSEPDLSIDEEKRSAYMTSTPACLPLHACPEIVFTPEDQDRKSMSPITRSTQRMTRAMQETMMTPRSRKPVLLLSRSNINALPKLEVPSQFHEMDNVAEENTEDVFLARLPITTTPKLTNNDNYHKCDAASVNNSEISALSTTFREYLNSREMITTSSPESFSFCSESEDLAGDKMSDSLLYCLNGNEPTENDVDMIDDENKIDMETSDVKENLVLNDVKKEEGSENPSSSIVIETSF